MSDVRPDEVGDETPTLEVRVYRHGELLTRELCESEEDAAAVVTAWEDTEGVECEVDDLAAPSHAETAFEIEPLDAGEAFPNVLDTTEPT